MREAIRFPGTVSDSEHADNHYRIADRERFTRGAGLKLRRHDVVDGEFEAHAAILRALQQVGGRGHRRGATRDRRDDAQRVAGLHRCLLLLQVPDVLVVQVDVDEVPQPTIDHLRQQDNPELVASLLQKLIEK